MTNSSRYERWIYIRDVLICTLNVFFASLYPKLRPSRDIDLSGKCAIITGANSGIGLQLAIDLARQQCNVYLACRDVSKGQNAAETVRAATHSSAQIEVLELDLSSKSAVRRFAQDWQATERGPIDFLFHNAGIPHSNGKTTSDGLDLIYATNFLCSFLLTALLETHLTSHARVIFTSAAGQYAGKIEKLWTINAHDDEKRESAQELSAQTSTEAMSAFLYIDTKLMQCLFAFMLQSRWRANGHPDRLAHAFTPGYSRTAIFDHTEVKSFRSNPLLYMIKNWTALAVSAEQGAATGFWLATTSDRRVVGKDAGGKFWDRMSERVNKAKFLELEVCEKAWKVWERDAEVVWS